MRIIFVGNPGSGKSFILNSLIGHVVFPSGVSIGAGLTQKTSPYFDPPKSTTFVDTPGLEDVEHIATTARQISNALSFPGPAKLVFVTTLEEGRVRPADVTTVKVVLDALETAGTSTTNKYAILVNKLSQPAMTQLSNATARDAVLLAFAQFKPTSYIAFFPFLDNAAGQDNLLNVHAQDYHNFLKRIPTLQLQSNEVIVQVRDYQKEKEQLERQLMATREAINRAQQQSNGASLLNDVNNPDNRRRLQEMFFGAMDGFRENLQSGEYNEQLFILLHVIGTQVLQKLLGPGARAMSVDGRGSDRDHEVD